MNWFTPRNLPLAAVLLALAAGRLATTASAEPHALLQQHHDHVFKAINQARSLGRVAPTEVMHVSLSLPLRNQAELDALLQDLYDPASPRFGQYLSNAEFTARFGPTEDEYQKLQSFAAEHKMTVTQTFSNRVVVTADVPAAAAEAAFHVHLNRYQRPDGTTFHAPDAVPAIDSASPVNILCVGGLDDAAPPRHLTNNRLGTPAPTAKSAQSAATNQNGVGGGYAPADVRKAYDVPSALNGAGQTMSILGYGGYDPAAIAKYQSAYGTSVPLENVYLDDTTASNQGNSNETILDVEMEIGMAPHATKLIAYLGNSHVTVYSKYVTENRAKVMSSSFAFSDGTEAAEHGLLQQMAAQGQSLFYAGGDDGYNPGPTENPLKDPYESVAGWNNLFTNPDGSWQGEEPVPYSSGGVNEWPIPAFQKGIDTVAVGGSTTQRNWPDLAVVGNNLSVYDKEGWNTSGGASAASPILAGLTTLINQQRALNGKGPIGYLNPAIYGVLKGSYYANDFHDQTIGDNRNSRGGEFAAVGYDLVTGIGSPILCNLLTDVGGGTAADFHLNFTPVTVAQGGTSTSTLTVAPLNGFSSSVALSLSPLPPGVTASLSKTSTSTASTLTVNATSAAQGDFAQGNCTIKVTATGGGQTHVAYVPVTVRATDGTVTAVNLSAVYNSIGIATDGATFDSGGINGGTAFSSKLLGASATFSGVKFTFGSPDVNNAVVGSATVPLPAGSYSKLSLLGGGFGDFIQSLPFKVTYTDGTTTTFTQTVCDYDAQGSFSPGETVVSYANTYANYSDGTRATESYPSVYGYSFALNPAKTVKSFTLPGDEFFTLAMALVKAPTAAATYTLAATPATVKLARCDSASATVAVQSATGFGGSVALSVSGLPAGVTAALSPASTTGVSKLTLSASDTATLGAATVVVNGASGSLTGSVNIALTVGAEPMSVDLGSSFTRAGLYTDGKKFTAGGLDSKGYALSGSLITSPVTWDATTFNLGPVDALNVVSATGQTLALPAGKFSKLRMLATTAQANAPSQAFIVTYTDGTTTTITQGISEWTDPQNYANESVAFTEIYLNYADGTKDGTTGNVYGYSRTITNTKTVKSLTLPNNSKVKILAITLVP